MFYRATFAVMVALAIWVAFVTIRIERMNTEAGDYLPRDHEGPWRLSSQATPRDQLYLWVASVGCAQYLFAPLVIGLAVFHSSRRFSAKRRYLAACCGVVGLLVLGLVFYREYLPSFGD